jgi:uncharacterized protein YbaR (Trm112 family)
VTGEAPGALPDLDPVLLELLVCPATRRPLIWDRARQLLLSPDAGLAYPVRDGVPVMLVEEAIAWPPEGGAGSDALAAQQRRQIP